LVIRTAVGGGVNFGPIHSETPTNWLLGQTGLKLVAPSNPADAKGLLKSAIRDSGPVVYFEHKLLYGRSQEIEGTIEPIEIGRATVTRPGTDVTMVAALAMVGVAEKSADELSDAGISAEVIDLRSLRPLDYGAILRSATKTGHVVVVEEGPPVGGYSAEVLATLLERAPGVRGRRVTTPNIPVPFSPPLEKAVIPDVGRVSRACVELLRAVTPSVVGGP
jgi:pyruvate/2-oxoglutarate/acetoin dehydrogenase E1 component